MSTFFDWDVLEDWFSDIINTVITWIDDAIEWTSRLIHKFIEYVNDWIEIISKEITNFFENPSSSYKREVFIVRSDRPIYDKNGNQIDVRADTYAALNAQKKNNFKWNDYLQGMKTSIEKEYVGIIMLEYENQQLVGYKMYDAKNQDEHDRLLHDIDENGGILKMGI